MAVVKLSHIISDVKGSIGGSIFGNTRNQLYIRAKTSQVNRVTPAQGKQRNFITKLTQSWRAKKERSRQQWNVFATNQPATNRVGDVIHLTGFNWFVKLNSNLFLAGQALINNPPSVFEVTIITNSFIVFNNFLQWFFITWQPSSQANIILSVFMTTGLSSGVQPKKNQFRFIVNTPATGLAFLIVTDKYRNVFGNFPAMGSKVWAVLRFTNGLTGAVFNSQPISTILTV